MPDKKNLGKIANHKVAETINKDKAINIASNVAFRIGKSTLRTAVPEPKFSWKPGLLREVLEVQTPVEGNKHFLTSIDPKTGEVLRWYDPDAALVTRASIREIDHAVALQQAKDTLKKTDTTIPTNAVSKVAKIDQAKAGIKYVVEWKHQIGGIEVEGDFIRVTFNAETMKPMMFSKNWTDVESMMENIPPQTARSPANFKELDRIAKSETRQQLNLSEAKLSNIEERFVKTIKSEGEAEPPRVEKVLVLNYKVDKPYPSKVEVLLDQNHKLVEVRQFR
jgi:hypothetical protein